MKFITIPEILNLCNKYPEIFSENSLSEIPIIGEVDGKIFSSKAFFQFIIEFLRIIMCLKVICQIRFIINPFLILMNE